MEISLELENEVYTRVGETTLVGVLDPNLAIKGWQHDLHSAEGSNPETQWLTTLPLKEDNVLHGFVREDWQSGVGTPIKLLEIFEKNLDIPYRTPVYETGSYWSNHIPWKLYSDYSVSSQITQIEDGKSVYQLDNDCLYGSIVIQLYARNRQGIIHPKRTWVYDEDLNPSTNCYKIEDGKVILSTIAYIQVGSGSDLDSITNTWEYHKALDGGFVVLNSIGIAELEVAVVNEEGITFLSEQDLDFCFTSGYEANKDLGIVEISGRAFDNVCLAEDLFSDSLTVIVFADTNFDALPNQGVIKIDEEYIWYGSKGLNSLGNLIRGVNGSTIDSHYKFSTIEVVSRGVWLSGDYYFKYKHVPRIDYEVTESNQRTATNTKLLNISELANVKANKIVQIKNLETILDSIELSIDQPIIGSNLYGPLRFGTSVARLTAKALDPYGTPLEDIEITIEKESGLGSIDGGTLSISESNTEGETYAYFNAPVSDTAIAINESDITYQDGNTLIAYSSQNTGFNLNDVYLFQVLKHDPTYGGTGVKSKAIAGGFASEPWGLGYLDCRIADSQEFADGLLFIEYDGVKYEFTIRNTKKHVHTNGELVTRFYLNEAFAFLGDTVFLESNVWVLQKDALVWSDTLKNGVKVLMYEWSERFEHPIKKTTGAYGPVYPDERTDTHLIYKNRILPLPQLGNNSYNLGGYVLIVPGESKFVARGLDPYTNTWITSNKIRCKIILPNNLVGVNSSGVLPIPHGFQFVSDSYNVGAGLGGANFLTINPFASNINQLSIKGSI